MYLYIQQNLYELVILETLISSKLMQNEHLKQINKSPKWPKKHLWVKCGASLASE